MYYQLYLSVVFTHEKELKTNSPWNHDYIESSSKTKMKAKYEKLALYTFMYAD